MKWYNFETLFRSLRNELQDFLFENRIKFEISGAGSGWHFEILTDTDGAEKINAFLDSVSIVNV